MFGPRLLGGVHSSSGVLFQAAPTSPVDRRDPSVPAAAAPSCRPGNPNRLRRRSTRLWSRCRRSRRRICRRRRRCRSCHRCRRWRGWWSRSCRALLLRAGWLRLSRLRCRRLVASAAGRGSGAAVAADGAADLERARDGDLNRAAAGAAGGAAVSCDASGAAGDEGALGRGASRHASDATVTAAARRVSALPALPPAVPKPPPPPPLAPPRRLVSPEPLPPWLVPQLVLPPGPGAVPLAPAVDCPSDGRIAEHGEHDGAGARQLDGRAPRLASGYGPGRTTRSGPPVCVLHDRGRYVLATPVAECERAGGRTSKRRIEEGRVIRRQWSSRRA